MAPKSKESGPKKENRDNGDDESEDVSKRSQYIGLGLIASVIVGFSPLRDALQGNGSFENAMFRFLACFIASVFAASILGRLIDAAPEHKAGDDAHGKGGGRGALVAQGGVERAADGSDVDSQDGDVINTGSGGASA